MVGKEINDIFKSKKDIIFNLHKNEFLDKMTDIKKDRYKCKRNRIILMNNI